MATDTKKKDNSFLYLASTVAFIVVGIILTSIINTTRTSTDIRSRASATAGVSATATINEIQYEDNAIAVDQLMFASSPDKNMGSWIVTAPASTTLDSLIPGTKIKLTIDPATLNIEEHTLTAKEIKKK